MRPIAYALVTAALMAAVAPSGAEPGPPVAVVTTPAPGFLPGGDPYDIEGPLEVMAGGTLVHANADSVDLITPGWGTHGIEADAMDASGDPLFSSDAVHFGGWDIVEGVELLLPGTYPFHCVTGLHAQYMRGVLVVTPSPA